MRASGWCTAVFTLCCLAARGVDAQQAGPGVLGAEQMDSASLFRSISEQARIRFEQGGVGVTPGAGRLLDGLIGRGMGRLVRDRPTPQRIAIARRSLNTFVDQMMNAAVVEDGARVVDESSFEAARKRCPPAKYPYCP